METDTSASGYAFANAAAHAHRRLTALEAIFDPLTVRHLESVGVEPGWSCLEVGAGAGSIACWLAGRVGPSGRVLATDIDPRWLAWLEAPNIEIRTHDISVDPLPEAAFDLVHARFVVTHLQRPPEALRRMVDALRPGGWLTVEDVDLDMAPLRPEVVDEDDELVNRVQEALSRFIASHGGDPRCGSRLPRLLHEAGLTDVGGEGYIPIGAGGTAISEGVRLSVSQARQGLVAGGLSAEDIDRALRAIDERSRTLLGAVHFWVHGRRPSGDGA